MTSEVMKGREREREIYRGRERKLQRERERNEGRFPDSLPSLKVAGTSSAEQTDVMLEPTIRKILLLEIYNENYSITNPG